MKSGGGLRVSKLNMAQYVKKWFESYSDAELWLENTTQKNDGLIRTEGGRHYIFVVEDSQEKQTL
jgi:hypothetical protein